MKKRRSFILSYQANAHLYERVNVKERICEALIQMDCGQLKSYTDSTIVFDYLADENRPYKDTKDELKKQFENIGLNSLFYTFGLVQAGKNGIQLLDTSTGDMSLNKHFQEVVATARKKLNIPDPFSVNR